MSKPLEQPDTFNVYMLLKQTGATLSLGTMMVPVNSVGAGFFWTRNEAEQYRTMEILKLAPTDHGIFHVYELEIPNLAKR